MIAVLKQILYTRYIAQWIQKLYHLLRKNAAIEINWKSTLNDNKNEV